MHRRLLLSISKINNALYISETTLDESFKASYHSHSNLEILLIVNGEGNLLTPHHKIKIKKGDVVIINANSKHCEVSQKTCAFYAIGITKSEAFLQENFQKKIINLTPNSSDFISLLSLYKIIFQEAESSKKSSEEIIANCYDSIIKIISRNLAINFNKTEKKNKSSLVANAINIIENNYYNHLTLNSIAHRLSVSSSLLAHSFKKETGKTIIEYKTNCQIKEACNLLQITDMSILDISFATGFSTASYFSETFKKELGISPKEYRNKIHN